MSRYIDAFKLKKKLREIRQRSITIDRMLKIIDEQPTADVQEVRRGNWFDKGSLSCRCSECGCKSNRESNFCPNCGAKMDKE